MAMEGIIARISSALVQKMEYQLSFVVMQG